MLYIVYPWTVKNTFNPVHFDSDVDAIRFADEQIKKVDIVDIQVRDEFGNLKYRRIKNEQIKSCHHQLDGE